MQRNFDNKDFEQFLKTNADQYRMYPSEKVWSEIHNSLHSRRRWAGITALLLLITGGIVTWTMLLNPASDKSSLTQKQSKSAPSAVQKNTPSAVIVPVLKNVIAYKPIASNKIPSIIPDASAEMNDISDLENKIAITSSQVPFIGAEALKEGHNISINNIPTTDLLAKSNISPLLIVDNIEANTQTYSMSQNKLLALPVFSSIAATTLKSKQGSTFQKKRSKEKIAFQIYFTPGISYRRLTENKEVILAASGSASIPSNLALQDVKNVVTHKPDIGFELGLAGKYSVSRHFAIKTGLQFNVNKYDIRAFSYSGEPATIAMQGSNQQQTVIRTSYYRNSSGYKPNWLTNVYLSLSMPFGAEFTFLNTKKVDLGLGINAQPTYLLDNRAYMISTDYKNYVKVPDLIRRWNVNAGAELIVGIKSGKTKWQIGPQIRYQTLSSFKDKYPVKENLFNFGLKAGVTINQ